MMTVQIFNEGVLLYAIYMMWDNLSICSDKCIKKVYVFMYEVIFDRNGAKAYVKNPRVLSQRKIRETPAQHVFR